MFLTKLSIKKPILIIMIILAMIMFGSVSFTKLPIDLMPDVEFPFVTVQTVYIGAGPEEIETSVVKPIEEQMTTINGIKNITSFCYEGVGFVLMEFNMDVDPDIAAIDVKDKIDAIINNLPDDLQKPIIGKFDFNDQPIVDLAITGNMPDDELRRVAEDDIKERLARLSGVASIEIKGGREREIQVNLKREKIEALDLNFFVITSIISSQTANIPAGHISGDIKEYTVRVKGEFESIKQIENINLPVQKGNVKLKDVAEIKDTFKEIREKTRFNNESSVGISILKRPDANTVSVAENIINETEKINKEAKDRYNIFIANDRSDFIKNSVNDTYVSIILGIILTAIILFLFYGDWRLTIIAAITMPASIIVALIGMEYFDFSLNVITLMALAISVGILVSNSIVVLENIVRHRDTGENPMNASEIGTTEVMIAVIASTMTNLAVFLPIASITGITGQIFESLALTIVFATIVSLFLSFTLTPLMSSRLLKERKRDHKKDLKGFEKWFHTVQVAYVNLLEKAMHKKGLIITSVIAIFIITMVFIAPKLGTEFFPQGDEGVITIEVEMPSGASLNYTDKTLNEIEKRISSIKDIKKVYTTLGGSGFNSGINIGSILITLKDAENREISTSKYVNIIRNKIDNIPDARIVVKERQSMGGGGSSADIEAEITGSEMDEILKIADSVMDLAKQIKGLADIKMSWKEAKPEIKFIPIRERLDEYGISIGELGMILRNSMTGDANTVYREGSDEFPIRIQYQKMDRNSFDDVENIAIPTRLGMVPVKALCEIKYEGGAASINRKNRERLVTVTANVSKGATGTKAAELKQLTDKIDTKPGYKIYYGGQQEMMAESFTSLIMAALMAIFLTYMVLAGILESFVEPFIIMFTLPLGFVGVVWALFITQNNISMISLMSIIMLIGIVVNNAILIIDYAKEQIKKQNLTALKAMLLAANNKFKAIIMMNLAIILAMLPQAIGIGSGGDIRAPFSITAIGGVLISTIFTLFFIPALYLIIAERKEKKNKAV